MTDKNTRLMQALLQLEAEYNFYKNKYEEGDFTNPYELRKGKSLWRRLKFLLRNMDKSVWLEEKLMKYEELSKNILALENKWEDVLQVKKQLERDVLELEQELTRAENEPIWKPSEIAFAVPFLRRLQERRKALLELVK